MTTTAFEAWRPGVLVAGAAPGTAEWRLDFMERFIDDAAVGLHPDVTLEQLASVAAMHNAAAETDLILREMTS